MSAGERGRVRLGAYAICLDPDRRILLCRLAGDETIHGRWTLPGGGVEFGEDPAAAVLRELDEETGLLGEIDGLASVLSRILPARAWAGGADVHSLAIVYRVRIVGGTLRDEVAGSSDRCAWFPLAEAKALPLMPVGEHGLRLAADPVAARAGTAGHG